MKKEIRFYIDEEQKERRTAISFELNGDIDIYDIEELDEKIELFSELYNASFDSGGYESSEEEVYDWTTYEIEYETENELNEIIMNIDEIKELISQYVPVGDTKVEVEFLEF